MKKFPVPAFLGTVGAPNGLDLVAFERKAELVLVHDHVPGKGYGQVVAQAFFGDAGGELVRGGLLTFLGVEAAQKIARIEDFEEQFVAFFTVFPHEGGEVLHGRGFNLLKPVQVKHGADGVENIVALRHFFGREVAGAFGYGGFLHVS
ncbi:MAG: hypothetical protein BWY72_01687 [Bacteroidetes bacterium ADurb.Bin416]|nr:MAG: hypothetical protein BWY72_01687 [Bacteroidetes bacterium ADurb.Bin416]